MTRSHWSVTVHCSSLIGWNSVIQTLHWVCKTTSNNNIHLLPNTCNSTLVVLNNISEFNIMAFIFLKELLSSCCWDKGIHKCFKINIITERADFTLLHQNHQNQNSLLSPAPSWFWSVPRWPLESPEPSLMWGWCWAPPPGCSEEFLCSECWTHHQYWK